MVNSVKVCLVGAKFVERDAELIRNVAKMRGGCVSDFIRYAILKELARLSYLSEEETKALGIEGRRI